MLTGSECGTSFVSVEVRAAATLILVRSAESGEGIEVLLLQRSVELDFASGAHVFPGGAVDIDDLTMADRCIDFTDKGASERLNLNSGGISFYVAAIRECFEEAGILFARSLVDDHLNSPSGHLTLHTPGASAKYQDYRRKLNSRQMPFSKLILDEDLHLTPSDLFYVSHWVTPPARTRRYDTRFFLGIFPEGQTALHDNSETIDSVWLSPAQALALHEKNELVLVFPTIRNLMALAQFKSIEQVVEWASQLKGIARIEPLVVGEGDSVRFEIPGEV